MTNYILNVSAQPTVPTKEFESPINFHARLPEYSASQLVQLPQTAEALGVAGVWIKDESSRMGLPSFKILGVSWATYKALDELAGHTYDEWQDVDTYGMPVVERSRRLRQ